MRKSLPEQIAANKRSSAFLTVLLILLLTALGTCIVGAYKPSLWPVGLAGSLVLAIGAAIYTRYQGANAILSMSGAREATDAENRMLRNVTEEMALASGIPMPKVYIIDDSAPNAFATGSDPKNGIVCVTSGLLQKLDRDELQGVIAHELAHIRNYDIRFMTTIALVAGMIPMISEIFLRMQWFGGGPRRRSSDNDNGGNPLQVIFMVLALVLSILAPICAKLLEMAVSRQREYLADATGAEMTRYPQGLANALHKISTDPNPLEAANSATQHMYILNPRHLLGADGLFSSHPPTAERIRRLLGTAGNRLSGPYDPLNETTSATPTSRVVPPPIR